MQWYCLNYVDTRSITWSKSRHLHIILNFSAVDWGHLISFCENKLPPFDFFARTTSIYTYKHFQSHCSWSYCSISTEWNVFTTWCVGYLLEIAICDCIYEGTYQSGFLSWNMVILSCLLFCSEETIWPLSQSYHWISLSFTFHTDAKKQHPILVFAYTSMMHAFSYFEIFSRSYIRYCIESQGHSSDLRSTLDSQRVELD